MFRLLSMSVALSLTLALGCSSPPPEGKAPVDAKTPDSGHDHASEGPHHGHLIEVGGGKYHAELTHDDATKNITIYLLGGDAKTAVPIAEPELLLNLAVDGTPTQAKLVAAPLEGEPAGQSSRFTLVDEQVFALLENPKATIRLNVTIEGKPYSEPVEHDHGHDHGHEHDHK